MNPIITFIKYNLLFVSVHKKDPVLFTENKHSNYIQLLQFHNTSHSLILCLTVSFLTKKCLKMVH